jgi:hypothetical protein
MRKGKHSKKKKKKKKEKRHEKKKKTARLLFLSYSYMTRCNGAMRLTLRPPGLISTGGC